MYCANAKRKSVQRMQMPPDRQTVREWGRWRVFVSTKAEYSRCTPERRRKRNDQPQSVWTF